VPDVPYNVKASIVLPSDNCFCCSCPEERPVKQSYGASDYNMQYSSGYEDQSYQKPTYGYSGPDYSSRPYHP